MKTLLQTSLAALFVLLYFSSATVVNSGISLSSEKRANAFNPLMKTSPDEYGLKLQGFVMKLEEGKKEKHLSNSCITVYSDRELPDDRMYPFETVYTNETGRFSIKLPLNGKFTILTTKEGCVPKIISVNTYVPDDRLAVFNLRFTIDLFNEIKGMDVDVLKEPIANISYNDYLNVFGYDYEYANTTNNVLKQRYSLYYHPKQIIPAAVPGKIPGAYGKRRKKSLLVLHPDKL